jgi:hypothetical protein
MIIEEFAPEFHYKPGVENIVADTLSRYPILARKEKQDEKEDYHQSPNFHNYIPPDADLEELEDKLKECLLYFPDHLDAFPLAFPDIATAQEADQTVQALLELDRYELQDFYGTPLVSRHDDNDQWRIVMPESLIDPSIDWYHNVLGHVGTQHDCRRHYGHTFGSDSSKSVSIRLC